MLEVYTKCSTEKPLMMNDDDLERCAYLSSEAWPNAKYLVEDQDLLKLMRLYVESSLLGSNWYAIIRENRKIMGFIFGRVESEITSKINFFSGLSFMKIFVKILLNRYGKIRDKFNFFSTFMQTETEAAKKLIGSDATIMLFVVDRSMRGLGLGRKLIDYFRWYAGSKGAKKISLYSDVESNWMFYEKVGFTKVADFRDAFLSHYKGKEIQSFVYQITTANN